MALVCSGPLINYRGTLKGDILIPKYGKTGDRTPPERATASPLSTSKNIRDSSLNPCPQNIDAIEKR